MPKLAETLDIERCPHCNVDRPFLEQVHTFDTTDHASMHKRRWRIYRCRRCGNVVSAFAWNGTDDVIDYFPRTSPPNAATDEAVPERARAYLQQALDSNQAPAGAVMLAASAVDAMLKAKGYTSGTLYSRIDKAANDHVITDAMAKWAHAVRLDANDQRHADDEAPLPDSRDAQRVVDFTTALAQFLYVLPSRVAKGIGQAGGNKP